MDDGMRAAILRLTPAERECLKRCLGHQTAKEMALDLGISPHAAEKRLKMARAKLGLSSSLAAAKLVEAAERSGLLVPSPSDLSAGDRVTNEADTVALPRNATPWFAHRTRKYVVAGAVFMSLFAAALMIAFQAPGVGSAPSANSPVSTTAAVKPAPGTEAALRRLVAGLASGSPDYDSLSPMFAAVVRRDLPITHPMFSSLGPLKSMHFRERGPMGGDVYDLAFANGSMIMSAALDNQGHMVGGILQPVSLPPTH